MQDFVFSLPPSNLISYFPPPFPLELRTSFCQKMKRKKTNPTTAEKHFCSEKYFIEMPEIPILCLGRTETPPKWVKQTELWWPAPTHCGTLAQSDLENGKPGSLSTLHLQQFLISPFWDLWELWASPSGLSPCKPSACAPACAARVLTQDLCQAKQFLRQECAAAAALCWILTHGQKRNASSFQPCSAAAACGGGTGLFAVQNDFNPNMETKLKKLF